MNAPRLALMLLICGIASVIAQPVGTPTSITITAPPNDVVIGPIPFTAPGTITVSAQGSGSVGVQATGGASGLAFAFQGTVDKVNYFTIPCVVTGASGTLVTTGSGDGSWTCQSAGYQQVRVNLTAISGGTETFTLNASAGSSQPPIGTQGTATNITAINGTAPPSAGVAGAISVGGTAASNAAITANPVNLGAQGVSAENTAVTTARQVQLVADLVGRLIVFPMTNKENLVSGTTAAMTGTTSTQVIAGVASNKLYITSISCVNSHATVGTFVTVQDGSGGTALATLAAASVFGGDEKHGTIPLFSTTAGNGLFVADVTTGANVICNASGFKGT